MKKQRDGFTLVELIVVLAIMAVLAGLLVPSLTGYIDKAKKAKSLANARGFLNAAQTVCSELYALDRQAVCNAGAGHNSCNVIIPLSNHDGKLPPPDASQDDTYSKYRRYRETYELYEEYLSKNKSTTQYEVIAYVENGVVKQIRYREKENPEYLEWTLESQEWNFVDVPADKAWIREIVNKVGAHDANWNGRDRNNNLA